MSPDGRWVLAERGRESDSPADRGRVDGDDCQRAKSCGSAEARGSTDSKRIVFTGDAGDGNPKATFRRIPAGCLVRSRQMVCFSLVKPRCATTTPSSVASAPHGSSFRFTAAMPSLFQRSSLEISRFSGATTADTCTRSTTLGVSGRQPLTSFAWSSRPAPGCSGKRSRLGPRGSRRPERHRGDHTGRAVVLLLLHATAWRPVRRRRAQVTSVHAVNVALRAVRPGSAVLCWSPRRRRARCRRHRVSPRRRSRCIRSPDSDTV